VKASASYSLQYLLASKAHGLKSKEAAAVQVEIKSLRERRRFE